jgi:hypothetical protein
MKVLKIHINVPDWLNIPLMILIPLGYVAFVVCLAVLYSPWFLLLFIFFPTPHKKKESEPGYEKKMKRLKEWHGQQRKGNPEETERR